MQDSFTEVMFWSFVALCTICTLLLVGEVVGLTDTVIMMVAELFV
jgi:hypothetical protein